MTQEEIIRMAQQVQDEGFAPVGIWPEVRRLCELAFAAGAAHEREACAEVFEDMQSNGNAWVTTVAASAAIRTRSNSNDHD